MLSLGLGLRSIGQQVSGSASFSPTDISGLQLWLDAADASTITETAGAVSQWDDKSGNSNHATQSTGSIQPTTGVNTINSLNILDFDSDYMTFPTAYLAGTTYTILVVEEVSNTDSFRSLIDKNGTGPTRDHLHIGYRDTNNFTHAHWGSDLDWDSGTFSLSTPRLWTAELTTTGKRIRLNGDLKASDVDTNQLTIGGAYQIGSGAAGDYLGKIGEIIIFTRELTTTELNQVENYLAAKWDIGGSVVNNNIVVGTDNVVVGADNLIL